MHKAHIAISLFILVFFCVILLPLQSLISDNPDALALIRGVGCSFGFTSIGLTLFGPKVYLILTGREDDKVLDNSKTKVTTGE